MGNNEEITNKHSIQPGQILDFSPVDQFNKESGTEVAEELTGPNRQWSGPIGIKTGNTGVIITKDGIAPSEPKGQSGSRWVDYAQGGGDIAGIFVPGVDAANAIGYGARGEWDDAALCAIGIVPLIGDAIGKGENC